MTGIEIINYFKDKVQLRQFSQSVVPMREKSNRTQRLEARLDAKKHMHDNETAIKKANIGYPSQRTMRRELRNEDRADKRDTKVDLKKLAYEDRADKRGYKLDKSKLAYEDRADKRDTKVDLRKLALSKAAERRKLRNEDRADRRDYKLDKSKLAYDHKSKKLDVMRDILK